MATTTIQIDAAKMGEVISAAPDQWITALEMTKGPNPPGQVENYLPYPWDRWIGGRFVLRDTAVALRPMFSLNPMHSGVPGSEFFHGPAIKFWGDLVLECCPIGSEWSLTVSDSPP